MLVLFVAYERMILLREAAELKRRVEMNPQLILLGPTRVLVVVAGEIRGTPKTWASIVENLKRPNGAATRVALLAPQHPYNELHDAADRVWTVQERRHRGSDDDYRGEWRNTLFAFRSEVAFRRSCTANAINRTVCDARADAVGFALALALEMGAVVDRENLQEKFDVVVWTSSRMTHECPHRSLTELIAKDHNAVWAFHGNGVTQHFVARTSVFVRAVNSMRLGLVAAHPKDATDVDRVVHARWTTSDVHVARFGATAHAGDDAASIVAAKAECARLQRESDLDVLIPRVVDEYGESGGTANATAASGNATSFG